MTTWAAACEIFRGGRAAVAIDGVVTPVTGIGQPENGPVCVTVALGDECLVLDLGPGVRLVDMDEESELERARR